MLDIFSKEVDGVVLWVGAAEDEEQARKMFKKFLAANPGV